jgi:hypothetical protein
MLLSLLLLTSSSTIVVVLWMSRGQLFGYILHDGEIVLPFL